MMYKFLNAHGKQICWLPVTPGKQLGCQVHSATKASGGYKPSDPYSITNLYPIPLIVMISSEGSFFK